MERIQDTAPFSGSAQPCLCAAQRALTEERAKHLFLETMHPKCGDRNFHATRVELVWNDNLTRMCSSQLALLESRQTGPLANVFQLKLDKSIAAEDLAQKHALL